MKPINVINATIKRDKNSNKRLVKILNSKMFKGYRIIQESNKDIDKNQKIMDYMNNESKTLDPFDDYYNIEYKRKNLSSLYRKDFSNLLQINKINKVPIIISKKREILKKMSVPIQKGEFFRNMKSIKLTKMPDNKDSYFYFNSNSQTNLINNQEKKEKLYNSIFQDNNEKGIYNDIPIFAIEKIHRVSNVKNKKIMKYIRRKEERINDLQFLYRVSHEKPIKKVDFRNKYNIKSGKTSIMENSMIRNNSKYIRLNTSFKNQHRLNFSHSSYLIPDFTIVNYSFNLNNINNEFQRNYSIISRKKLFYDKATQKKESNLRYSSSAGDLNINHSKLLYKENKNKKHNRPYSSIFPMERRIISDKIIKDQIDFKKWKFYKLKTLMK